MAEISAIAGKILWLLAARFAVLGNAHLIEKEDIRYEWKWDGVDERIVGRIAESAVHGRGFPGWQNVALIGGSNAGGNIITESCELKKEQRARLDVFQSDNDLFPVVVANTFYSMFSPGVSGNRNFSTTVFGGYLSTKPSGENFTYGMTLSHNTGSSSDGGYLHLIQPDNSFFQGDIAWKTMQTFNATSLNTDFYIELDSWTLTTGSGNVSRTGSLITAIDPIYETLIFPQQDAGSLCPFSSVLLYQNAVLIRITGAYVAGYTNSTTYYTFHGDFPSPRLGCYTLFAGADARITAADVSIFPSFAVFEWTRDVRWD
ncbi:hypothetical protein IW261DRAFT_1425990 [Armillaria novae-zelandiae]|uniref:Uncharacterized protein n=1 Tax=Armillaria novae-zelandiae TaxID=153914 RepID=A0AA39NNJ9_9AGAR|nr:hypothetical protein IW261DRAFT_1425990 [Armillaria novae-zelandiae]